MAFSINKVTLLGNLGRDPEVRHTNDGKPIVNLSLATSESWRDKNSGERKEKVEWHRVVIFNENLAKIAEQYLKKGTRVYLEGQLQTRKYTDNSGAEKYTTEIVLQNFRGELGMLGDAGGGSNGGGDDRGDDDRQRGSTRAQSQQKPAARPKTASNFRDLDDEIPF